MSFFISIEGFDGTGKTTQASILKKNLDDLNIDSILVREPGSTSFSEKIREILKENTEIETLTELLLFQFITTCIIASYTVSMQSEPK